MDSKPQRSGIPILQRRGSRNKMDIPNGSKTDIHVPNGVSTTSPGNGEPARPPPSPPIDIPGRAHRIQSEDEEEVRVKYSVLILKIQNKQIIQCLKRDTSVINLLNLVRVYQW